MDLPLEGDIPYSYSRPDLVAVTKTRLELSVNFRNKVLEGKAILTVEKKASTCNELVLDTYRLRISDVLNHSTGTNLHYTKEDDDDENFGSRLTITLPDLQDPRNAKRMKFNIYRIRIEYRTSPRSPALYWLKREQTSDGVHPLLISSSKLTYARAIFPCQDTPSNRITFDSKITVPSDFIVLMPSTGLPNMLEEHGQRTYTFTLGQYVTVAPHEIYIIVGPLIKDSSIDLYNNLRCNLWTEQKYLRKGRDAIRNIMGKLSKIKWSYGFTGDVNVCVLPPNVPEFDMQCGRMTFVSSTLLEGDYSIIDTIVRNIIESWIEKIVRIEHFRDLWLIKGLSTFIHRINSINNIIDDEKDEFPLRIKGINDVLIMPELQNVSLVPVFTDGLLPKDIIKYVSEKGCAFLYYLQDILGDSAHLRHFLVQDIIHHFRKTEHFKVSLYNRLRRQRELLDTVEWNKWFNEPLFPPSYSNTIKKTKWHLIADEWIEQQEADRDRGVIREIDDANNFVKTEFLTYLLTLPVVPTAKLDMLRLALLDDQKICEIRFPWLRLCIKSRDLRNLYETLKFASECMPKYACSIFRDLYDWEEVRQLTQQWFMAPDKRSTMLRETIEELSSILEVELRSTVDLGQDPLDAAY